jgi:hypothetical protein
MALGLFGSRAPVACGLLRSRAGMSPVQWCLARFLESPVLGGTASCNPRLPVDPVHFTTKSSFRSQHAEDDEVLDLSPAFGFFYDRF